MARAARRRHRRRLLQPLSSRRAGATCADAQVVAWCDSDSARAQAMASEFAIPRRLHDAAAMLDAVRPTSSTSSRRRPRTRRWWRMAHARGIPVICQKPLDAVVERIGRARRCRRSRGRAAAWCTRTSASSRGIARRGACSTTARSARRTSVAFRLRPGDGQGPRAYLDRQPYFQTMPRLLVVETAIHWIDTFRFLMGEVDARSPRACAASIRSSRRGRGLPHLRVRRRSRPASSTATAPTTTSPRIRAARWARCGSKAPRACCASTATRACGGSRTTAPSASMPTTAAPTTLRRRLLRRAAAPRRRASRARRAAREHRRATTSPTCASRRRRTGRTQPGGASRSRASSRLRTRRRSSLMQSLPITEHP